MKAKKILAAVLAGTMVMASAVAVSAASLGDVTSSVFWEGHTSSIAVADGDTVTISFTQTVDADAADAWDGAVYCVYTASEPYDQTSDAVHNDIAGYSEYFVCRSDMYGWTADGNTIDGGMTAVSSFTVDSAWEDGAVPDSLKSGVASTITASLSGSSLTIVYAVGSAQCTAVITVDASSPVYVDITGEMTTLSNISYESTSGVAAVSAAETTAAATTSTTTGTGDAAPIAAVAIALIGCGAIVIASRKKNA